MAKIKYKVPDDVQVKVQEKAYAYFYSVLSDNDYLINIIKSFILVGISPVAKWGRFQKYSDSYKQFIQGKIRFITMNGAVRPVFPYKEGKISKKKGAHTPLNFVKGKLTKNKNGTYGKSGKFPPPIAGKKISPVNLTATGTMLNSMYLEKRGKKIILGISDKKAKWHNTDGVGRSQVVRRMLPTGENEKFISNIDVRLKQLGKLAVAKGMESQKALLTIKYVFKIGK